MLNHRGREKKKKNCGGNHNSLQNIYIDLSLSAFMSSNSEANHLNGIKVNKRNIERVKDDEGKTFDFYPLFMITIMAKENNANSDDALHFFSSLLFFLFSLDLYNKRKPCL